jgi:hypothetical protein
MAIKLVKVKHLKGGENSARGSDMNLLLLPFILGQGAR